MSRKPRKSSLVANTEVPEGSPADWFARGYEAGLQDGYAGAIRDVAALSQRIRRTAEQAALAAQAAEATDRDASVLGRELQARYGKAARHPDRWQEHPAYRLGVRAYADRYVRKAPKASEAEPGPSLTLGDPALPPAAEGEPETEARRAAGRAWRA